MRQKLRATLALLLSCLMVLSGCTSTIGKLTGKVKTTASLRPTPVGVGLKFMPTEHFTKGFQTKYPLSQGSWSIEKPLIDPLGSESDYSYVNKDYTYGEIQYIDEDYRMTNQKVAGDHWVMEFQEDAPDAMLHLEKYILDLGGEILSPATKEIAFTLEKDDGFIWWGKITPDEAIKIELYREKLLEVGKTLTITPADRESLLTMYDRMHFTTRHGGNRRQSLTVTLTNAEEYDNVLIWAVGGYHSGEYKREVLSTNQVTANTLKSRVFILDDIPQEPGETKWDFSVEGDSATVSFTLNEIADLTPIKYGEEMGALLVKGVPYGSVSVPLSVQDTFTTYQISHPDIVDGDLSLYGDQTPEGDLLFWLPSGYWKLNIDSDVLGSTSHARGIPVSEGELTVVDMASNIRSLFSQSSDLGEGTTEQGMTFLDAPKEQGDHVTLKFLLFDDKNKNAIPTIETTRIYENAAPVEIVSVERLDIPPSVVLLLDSSGSMEDQMKPAVEAAKAFVQGLPDNASIQVVDFDSTGRKLPGTTKAEVIKSLDSAVKGGSTALYDAAIMGLGLLQGAQRPTLVMFTDGMNEPAPGGLTDRSVVIEAMKASGIPVYTIVFGKEHAPAQPTKDALAEREAGDEVRQSDGSDLVVFAKVSEGKYYSAGDQDALQNVFSAIATRLGNAYTAVYKRPQQSSIADTPVLTVVLDHSGSIDGSVGDLGTRMIMTKDIFRRFFAQLPDSVMTQLISFTDVTIDQVLTSDKGLLLQALSAMPEGGGTDIPTAATLGYETLRDIPTSKRMLIFLTDASMPSPSDESFEKLLEQIKKADIKSLWIGLGLGATEDEDFAWAAKISGGSHLLTDTGEELGSVLEKMLGEVMQQKATDKTVISMEIALPNEEIKTQSYASSIEHTLAPLKSSGKTVAPPQAIKISTGLSTAQLFGATANMGEADKSKGHITVAKDNTPADQLQYSPEVSQLLYGGDSPSTDTQIISRVPLKAKEQSKGLEMTATEYYRMGKLRGIEAPKGMEFLAVNLQLKNLFSDGPFKIPDIASHFYMGINELGLYPPRTGSSCLCQTVRQVHIALWWGLSPVLNTLTPGAAVMGYIHPTKKGTPENYSILLGFLFILTIIATSFAFFNWCGHS